MTSYQWLQQIVNCVATKSVRVVCRLHFSGMEPGVFFFFQFYCESCFTAVPPWNSSGTRSCSVSCSAGVSSIEVNIGAATPYVKHCGRKTILNVLKISLACEIQLGRSLQQNWSKKQFANCDISRGLFPSLFSYELYSNLYWEKKNIL